MCKPEKKQFFELLLIIVLQYFQPYVSYSSIKIWLDDITQDVLSRLKNKYPAHSIFSMSSEKFSVWRNNNINDNFWDPTEARQIMHIIEEFVFSELEVSKLHQLWEILDLEDKICVSYINYCIMLNYVMHKRSYISLSISYKCTTDISNAIHAIDSKMYSDISITNYISQCSEKTRYTLHFNARIQDRTRTMCFNLMETEIVSIILTSKTPGIPF